MATESPREETTTPPLPVVTIRVATDADAPAVARLAALDDRSVPADPLLLAELDGELQAAMSLTNGATIADPFHRTAELVHLLATAAKPARASRARLPRRWLLRAMSPGAARPNPASPFNTN